MKKFWKSPWAHTLASAVLGFISTLIADCVKGIEVFSTLKIIITTLIKWMTIFLNFEIRVWWILAFVGACIILLILLSKYFDYKNTQNPPRPDVFQEYTSDTLQGVCWEWYWSRDSFGDYQLKGLTPVCPECKTPMVLSYEYHMNHVCPRCTYQLRKHLPDEAQIVTLIYDNIRRKASARASEYEKTCNRK